MINALRIPLYLAYVQLLLALYEWIGGDGGSQFGSLPPLVKVAGFIAVCLCFLIEASLVRFFLRTWDSYFLVVLAGLAVILNMFLIGLWFPRALLMSGLILVSISLWLFEHRFLDRVDRLLFGFMEPDPEA